MRTLHNGAEGASIVRYETSLEAEELLGVFEAVSSELGWQPGDQIRAHVGRSTYFAALLGARVVGGVQLIVADGLNELPSQRVWPEIDLTLRTDVAHVAILALLKDYRGKDGLFGPLVVEMWRHCAASGIEEIWLEATPQTLKCYQRIGWPLQIAGELRQHWGEDCYPCRMGIREVALALFDKSKRSPATSQLVHQAYREAE